MGLGLHFQFAFDGLLASVSGELWHLELIFLHVVKQGLPTPARHMLNLVIDIVTHSVTMSLYVH